MADLNTSGGVTPIFGIVNTCPLLGEREIDNNSNRNWPGAIFGLIFFSAGLLAAYGGAGAAIIGYVGSNNWVEVPASIQHVKLITHYGDSRTYEVESTYSYRFNGIDYQSDRVGLSTGSDNLGTYWQDLERTLLQNQKSNQAFVFVNPDNPTQSLLDRTLRWKTMVFAFMFLFLFCGAGGPIAWVSLRKPESRKDRLQTEQDDGISSDQKISSWLLAAFGGAFFVLGSGISLIALPEAISKGEYGVLSVLIFVLVGAGIMFHAFKINRAYRRFGPTPLFLDPMVPGVGGQLGGRFSINASGIDHTSHSAIQLQARLTCIRKTKAGKTTRYHTQWQEETSVYLKQTAKGIEASFLFDIAKACSPSQKWSRGSSIEWKVTVNGDFNSEKLGMFERSWEIIVEDNAAQASNILNIPESFIEEAKQKTDSRVKTSALGQVPVTEDGQYIIVDSKAGRHTGSKLVGLLVGAVFVGVAVFTISQGWWPGYFFIPLGVGILVGSLYVLGKSIGVIIDKSSRVLHTQESWFGYVYANHQADVLDADQFTIRNTSSSGNHTQTTYYYVLEFTSGSKKIRIADGIEGEREALALKDAIVNRCFDEEQYGLAA